MFEEQIKENVGAVVIRLSSESYSGHQIPCPEKLGLFEGI
jgi:hypothetical protein